MRLYVCITDDARLLPHFLRHYAKFGITEFHIAVPRKLTDYVSEKSQGFDVRQYNSLDVEDSVIGGVAAVTAMRMETQGAEEWVAIVDLDEFVEFGEQAPRIAERYGALGCNVVCGTMYDRFAADGPVGVLPKVHLRREFLGFAGRLRGPDVDGLPRFCGTGN